MTITVVVVSAIYDCIGIALRWCSGRRRRPHLPTEHPQSLSRHQHLSIDEETTTDLENSTVQLAPRYRYAEEEGLREITCSVCLCELKEGEEVRQLPKCNHLFHVPCIDMWLYSHSSCPLCRTEMMPLSCLRDAPPSPPPTPRQFPDLELGSRDTIRVA
ncbi:RING-H2 finger protein ATL2-like [Tasmannia lanceolata]|uniref:RING-H2 finger protein ATL2-like n=1 Tax=Tasmannia lanceolata TaxID=3420 RepID=UPI0040629E4E